MEKRFIIETSRGFVTTNKGHFTSDINSARVFKTENAAKSNRYLRADRFNGDKMSSAKLVPVKVSIERIENEA